MKHDHKKTSKLKVCLFTIVMLLPCFAVGITCLTHVFNKEVAEETETATINYMYETEQLELNEQLKDNYIYQIDNNNTNYSQIYCKYIKLQKNNNEILEIRTTLTENQNTIQEYLIYNIDDQLLTYKQIYGEQQTIDLSNLDPDYTIYFVYSTYGATEENQTLIQITNGVQSVSKENIPVESVEIETNPQDQTTNIFYDSCEQVEDSFILNWCNNANPVRTPIEQFTNAFSLPSNHIINTLITYWLCIAMIYIVIDIIVECVVMITHFFNKEF